MKRPKAMSQLLSVVLAVSVSAGCLASVAQAQTKPAQAPAKPTKTPTKRPDFPPSSLVLNGYEKVVSSADGKKSLYTIWTRKKDGQMLAELPAAYASQKHFIALTISSGERFAGLQAGDMYVYWRRYDKRLALIEPNVVTRSNGDAESKASVKRLFTDRMILAVPILAIGPGGGPIIDMDGLLVGQAAIFFGPSVSSRAGRGLFTIKKAKAFEQNVELAFEVATSRGRLQTLHYSISSIPSSTGYKPRKADERIGYFTTAYSDLGKYSDDETRVRFINRWHLEKRDSKLKLSPAKRPIVFYIEHTAPVRYRRWIKEGILAWNKAFEKIGISDAIMVYYQDAVTKEYMQYDPEDVRYNFVRWLNNDVGTAIGPSRVNPLTGQILDADIILTDGWIRHYRNQFHEVMPKIAMQGFNARTLAWLGTHPNWDPRIRLAAPAQRARLRAQLARQAQQPLGGHPAGNVDPKLIGDDPFDGLIGRTSQVNGLCFAADGKAFDLALMRMHLDIAADTPAVAKKGEEKKEEKKKDVSLLDGMPESFVGPLLANLVAHEVGHTLGLRHNFKGSSIYTLAEINSEKLKGKKPLAGSVMDYTAVNMNMKGGKIQGDYTMIGIGPYDEWAIEYGYSFAKDLKPILSRVAEPQLVYGTDEDTGGPDPLARRYDFGKNPLDYAQNQMRIARHNRARIVDKFVKDGDSWSKARRGYELTLSLQMRSVSMMANWVGGAFVNRDKKGDKNGRLPVNVVPADTQRAALKFVIENMFEDKAFGLTPELLQRMSVDKWLDGSGFSFAFSNDATWPVHDRIMGLQASTLTMILNPTTLQRVYDNEFRVPAKDDAVTLPELLDTVRSAIWSELDQKPEKQYTAREPAISSLRRNLQREHVGRLVDLSMPGAGTATAYKPISNLALQQLRDLRDKAQASLKNEGGKLDPYSRAHLSEVQELITKALDAQYIYNANDIGGGAPSIFYFGQETPKKSQDK